MSDYMDPHTARTCLERWARNNLKFMADLRDGATYGVNLEWMRLILAVAEGEGYRPLSELTSSDKEDT